MKGIPKGWVLFFVLLFFISPLIVYIFYFNRQETKVMDAAARKKAPGNFIKLSQGITHYQLAGQDTGSTLVLIHGGSVCGIYVWEKNYYDLVKAGFRVLRYDLYGRGYSDRPDKKHDLDLFTDQLGELIDSLNIKGTIHLAGVSMGANIAIDFTHRFPEKVDKLILVDPAAINPGRVRWYLKSHYLADFLMTVYWVPRSVEKQLSEFYDGAKQKEYELILKELMQYKGFKHVFKSTWLNILTENLEKSVIEIGKHNRKVLLFWGKQDPVIPVRASKRYIDAIPGIQYVEVDKAGHISNYERSEVVNPVFIDFLKEYKSK